MCVWGWGQGEVDCTVAVCEPESERESVCVGVDEEDGFGDEGGFFCRQGSGDDIPRGATGMQSGVHVRGLWCFELLGCVSVGHGYE